jgi:hypothetical protein
MLPPRPRNGWRDGADLHGDGRGGGGVPFWNAAVVLAEEEDVVAVGAATGRKECADAVVENAW